MVLVNLRSVRQTYGMYWPCRSVYGEHQCAVAILVLQVDGRLDLEQRRHAGQVTFSGGVHQRAAARLVLQVDLLRVDVTPREVVSENIAQLRSIAIAAGDHQVAEGWLPVYRLAA